MKNTTLVYLATYFHPFIGGVEKFTLEVSDQLSKRGCDIHVLTADRRGDERYPFEDTYRRIKIHRMRTWFRFSLNLVFYPSLIFKLISFDADVILVNYMGIFWHDVCLIIKKVLSPGTVFINVPHDKFMGHENYPSYQKVIKWTYTRIQRLFLNWLYDAVVQVNPSQYTWMTNQLHIQRSKIHFVHPGIAEDSLKVRSPEEVIVKYDLADKFIISYVGRIERYKGILDMIDALPKVLKKNPKAVFVFGGKKTPHVDEILDHAKRKKVADHIIYIDTPSDEEKFSLLSASEIFASPSSSEGFGITTVEAMAQGNAILTTENEGSKFLVKHGENGLLSKPGDTEQLTRNCMALMEDNALRQQMKEKNLAKATQFTWEKTVENGLYPLVEKLLLM